MTAFKLRKFARYLRRKGWHQPLVFNRQVVTLIGLPTPRNARPAANDP